eukprot:CAMPEP_0202914036 /NCGR_PEP_ID=MMETSP1392-20130828/62077_1 /ASSEMBLY_ACC=CAM_ASM_000868 /TAXON_ID=225041 /ORGANISM="Chlamydomonas chlamydogama, Strain SAG 11-48b" /LENGTH=611 /DNA_ID=CAMNT_0049605539 /DNA_START=131 /DNA_END=1966 /DNA_ORIENTATION=-
MESYGGGRYPPPGPGAPMNNGAPVVSAGRRAGNVRPFGAESPTNPPPQPQYPPAYPPGGPSDSQANAARYGRRASPPTLDANNAGYMPSAGPRPAMPGQRAPSPSGARPAPVARAPSPSGGRPTGIPHPGGPPGPRAPSPNGSRIAGLQQLKQASTARLGTRAASPTTGSGYVPSSMAGSSPARQMSNPGSGAPGPRPQGMPPGQAGPPPMQRPMQPGMQPPGAAPGPRPMGGPPPQGMAPGGPRPAMPQQPGMGPRPAMPPGMQQPGGPPPQRPMIPQQQRPMMPPPQQQPPGPAAGAAPRPMQQQPGAPAPAGAPPGAPVAANNRAAALAALAQRKQQQQQLQLQQQMQQMQGQQAPPMQRPPPMQQAPPMQRPPPMQQAPPQRQAPPPRMPPGPPKHGHGHGGSSWEDQPVSPSRGFGSLPPGLQDDPGASGPMVECHSCGRSFNHQAYQKHAKVCAKVFGQKRKAFNAAAARVAGTEAAKYFDPRKGPKPGAPAAAPTARAAAASHANQPVGGGKKSKWRLQSEQFRAAMRANRMIQEAQARGEDIKNINFNTGPQPEDDRVQCPHCGRKFAELTAQRHIPKCKETIAKPNFLKAGGGTSAHMRSKR